LSSLSAASASRISACRRESRTFWLSSEYVTTRYSTWMRVSCESRLSLHSLKLTSSPHNKASRSLPFALFQISRSCCLSYIRQRSCLGTSLPVTSSTSH
jgi:hypothetical protein